MSTRERWVVYPLLFLALFLTLKMSYQNTVELRCRSIDCYSLSVKMLNGQPIPPEGLPILVPRASGSRAAEEAAPERPSQPVEDGTAP